nr:DNA repair protein REV1 [Onthophagus taurus]
MSKKRQKNRDEDNGFGEWGGYMEAKKAKLSEQFDVISSNIEKKSLIFEGISILVNGYTQPSADELKFLMAEHGGRFHLYPNQRGVTTHIIATNLPNIKINQGNIPVVNPKWITDSIDAKKLVYFKKYLLYSNESKTQPKLNLNKNTKTANDPEFLAEFYNNSRLHLISTLGAEFKQFVNELREKSIGNFPGLNKLMNSTKLPRNYENCVIMHIDMDCFFVSVGLRSRPELKGRPVAVTHSKTGQINRKNDIKKELEMWGEKNSKLINIDNKSSMSEIASCSYEARKSGVRNGMLMGAALKLCPDLTPIPYDFDEYKKVSKILYETISEYTVDIEAVSCDEMYVDVTGILKKTGVCVDEFAKHIRGEISLRTGCPCSAGFGENRLQARMATKKAKPNGQYHLKDGVLSYFESVKLEDLPGVGWSTLKKLKNLRLETCGDVQGINLNTLQSELGEKLSKLIQDYSRGIDPKPLQYEHERKSVSADVNYGIRFKNHEESLKFLESLSKEVFFRLSEIKMKSKCVTLKLLIRAKDAPIETAKYLGCGVCDALSRSTTTNFYLDSSETIFKEAKSLYQKLGVIPEDLRGVGIQLSRLEKVNKVVNNAMRNFLTKKLQDNEIKIKRKDVNVEKPEKKKVLTNYFKVEKLDFNREVKKKGLSVDMDVLKALPEEIQKEIIDEYDLKPLKVNTELNKPKLIDTNKAKKTKSFSDLSLESLRVLLKNWINTEPKEIDVEMLGGYLKSLAIKRDLNTLYPIIRFIYRIINEKSCVWHEIYAKLIDFTQKGMKESFGKLLHVEKKFYCGILHF